MPLASCSCPLKCCDFLSCSIWKLLPGVVECGLPLYPFSFRQWMFVVEKQKFSPWPFVAEHVTNLPHIFSPQQMGQRVFEWGKQRPRCPGGVSVVCTVCGNVSKTWLVSFTFYVVAEDAAQWYSYTLCCPGNQKQMCYGLRRLVAIQTAKSKSHNCY